MHGVSAAGVAPATTARGAQRPMKGSVRTQPTYGTPPGGPGKRCKMVGNSPALICWNLKKRPSELGRPTRLESQCFRHRESAASHPKCVADIGYALILPLFAHRRNFGRDNASVCRRRERISDQKRIATDLECQSACKFDPVSASNFDPFERRVLTVALVSSELAGIAETRRARVA